MEDEELDPYDEIRGILESEETMIDETQWVNW